MTIIPIPMTNDIIESAIPLGAGSRRRNIDPEILSGPLYEGKSSVSTTYFPIKAHPRRLLCPTKSTDRVLKTCGENWDFNTLAQNPFFYLGQLLVNKK